MIYFDTSYLARLYTKDTGWEKVRALAATDKLACCVHGQAEVIAAFHRKFREGVVNQAELRTLLGELRKDTAAGAYQWLPLSPDVIVRISAFYASLPSTIALRAADAIHLACAGEAGLSKVYSNDGRLLSAAGYFGLKGENIL